jgi:hypothetical protein
MLVRALKVLGYFRNEIARTASPRQPLISRAMKLGLMTELGSNAKLTLQYWRHLNARVAAKCLVRFEQYSSGGQSKTGVATLNRATGSFDYPSTPTSGAARAREK